MAEWIGVLFGEGPRNVVLGKEWEGNREMLPVVLYIRGK